MCGLVTREGLHHQLPVPDVGKAGMEGRLDPSPAAVHFDPVEVEFAEIHQDQGLGAIPADLADQLRSDRAAGPSDRERASDAETPISFPRPARPFSRPMRSSIETSRIVLTVILPSISSPILGMVRYRFPVLSQISTTRRITSPLAEGIAMRISSNGIGISSMSPMAPRTGTP